MIDPLDCAPSNNFPQLGERRSPNPKNDNVDSVKIAPGTINVALAIINGVTPGNTCRKMICQVPAPSARARSTYARSLKVNTWARTSRALPAHDVMPITIASVTGDLPRMTASTIASGRNGTTRKNSSIAKSTVATFPFTYPATSPTVEPITTATTVAKMPIKSDTREPHTNCAKTSRPMSSVPSKNCALGEAKSGLLRPAAANKSDRSAINGAHNATNPNPSSTNRLTKPARS